ncbi:MAG: hypothetical protein JWN04_4409, partial [Myxococcaceae bacterium]|nr:hypothetical protein [Myxococcaceae bacterium]
RMATSILLAAPADSEARGVERIRSFVEAWYVALAEADRAPIEEAPSCRPARALLKTAADSGRVAWLDKRVESDAKRRQFKRSDTYQRVVEPRLLASVVAGVRAFAAESDCAGGDDWPQVLDVAARVAGTGSLGRFRWAILIAGKSQKLGKERVLELKEARPAWLEPHDERDPAEHVTSFQRVLQGAPPRYLGVAHVEVGGLRVACTVRELQPSEAKVDTSKLKHDGLDSLVITCGTALGRLHGRGAGQRPSARADISKTLADSVAAYAVRYAERVVADHERLRKQREQVALALGLTPGDPP